MTVYEMEGFLRGNGIPGDLKVNESNAQYLVRKFSELQSQNADLAVQLANAESKCRELAAENAALKSIIEAVQGVANQSQGIAGWHLNGAVAEFDEILPEINNVETPATDAFLAEVRAQGVEMFADALLCPDLDAHILGFAAQLRKGGAA